MNAGSGLPRRRDYRFIDPGADAGRFVADMAPVDVDGDGYVDVIYAVDTRGNVWRINTSDPATGFTGYADVADWPVQKIAPSASGAPASPSVASSCMRRAWSCSARRRRCWSAAATARSRRRTARRRRS